MRRVLYFVFLSLFFLAGCAQSPTGSSPTATQPAQPTSQPTTAATPTTNPYGTSSIPGLKLPPGFQISVYAQGLNAPRFMTIGPNGVLLVANRGANSIVALPQGTSPAQAGKPIVVASNLDSPTSLVMHDGYLYVGENTSIARMKLGNDLKAGPAQRIITGLPVGGHSTRTVLIGPDNHIYVATGSSCNVCIETEPHRASVWIYDMDGTHGRLFSKGLRNAVGLTVNPWSQKIWADVNGRDLLGDNIPPETLYELNDQADYGWPRCHAGDIRDPQFGQSPNACNGVGQPLLKMQAHSAPLGLDFYPTQATQFPEQYRDSLFMAFHGSWNRTVPTGFKVVRIPLSHGSVAGPAEDFITGWLKPDGSVTNRPVGITFAPDGTLFVSDDNHGTIFHVWYHA